MSITKIQLKKGKPTIAGSRAYPGGAVEDFKVEGIEIAEGLIAQMSGLLDTLINACFLAGEWDEGEITGVSLKSVEHDYGVTITGQLKHDDGVVVVNSPYLSPDALTQSEQMAIKRIITAADDYLNALPEQLSLLDEKAAA